MKIRKKAILMALVVFCLNFTAFSQNINLNLNNVTVKKAMETLKEENGYSFVFASGDINTQKVIRVKVNNGTIDQVVKQILQDQKVSYEIKNKNIIVQKNESSNQTDSNKKKVTGTVVDVNGLPIIGANIVEKGTTNGIITDMDGNFQLETAGNATLQISYIGYVAQSIPVGKQANLTITLKEDFQNIDEVVVVGYGSVKKSDLTGSISSISAKDFNKGISRSPDQLLAGKVPGLMVNRSSGDPNSSVTMQLRGPSSLTASTAPFYVIDGIPGASINLVSPDDIESMNVLKDASATAIYGSRAANGVIMVTTRKGRTGKPQVTYSGYAALESVSGRVNVLNADEHRAFLAEHDMSLAASDEGNGAGTDWQKELLRGVGFSHSHNLSLVGGSENTKYNASVNYLSNEGIVKHSNYDRLVARIGVDQDALNNRLHIGLSVSGSFIGSDHVDYSIFNYAARWLPESPVMSDDPAYQQYGGYFQVPGRMTYYNPVAILEQRSDHRSRNILQGTGKIGLDIIDGLRFDMLTSIQTETYDQAYYQKTTDIAVLGKGNAIREFLKNTDKLIETTLNYSKTFARQHELKLMAGYSYQKIINNDGIRGTNNYFTSDATGADNLSVGNGDKAIHFQNYPNKRQSVLVSFFGRVNYGFDNRYLLTATLRRDGSSKFGANNKWAMFPSVSVAWKITGEKFMENQSFFQDLKLRVGYGKSGNQNIDPYTSLTLYGPQSSQFIYNDEWINSYGVTQNPNPDLKWESTSMTNIGIDYSIFGGRVSGSLEVYNKETKDMLYKYNVPSPPYQYNQLLANGASMTNKGIEFMANVVAVDNRDFSWISTFNIASNKNKIGSLASNIENLSIAERYEGTMTLEGWTAQTVSLVKPGLPIGTFYTFKYVGYDEEQQKTLYENAAGETVTIDKLKSPDDYKEVGKALPKVTFGWNNTFRYKQWDLNFFLRGMAGNKIFNASRADLSRLNQAATCNISHEAVKDGIMEAPQPSSRWLENGSFLKLDNLTLGYQFNMEKVKEIGQLRLYVTGQNLFTITKYTGVDPEVSLSGLAPGIDNRNYYPKTRSFLLGVNISF
ncbi:TonB-dependent receptor [uncultured Parabacteroides sp.]|uniref:TonB-dependent receptor n=1 Tax=uncultured Parabacteroides sp. TaxID=512312 RepID=UPI0025930E3C|nr:TonB-dependent receptor [uncultured Parabacteroides sp.]